MRKNILVLAPHTDDGEFGCGGTIAKYIKAGHRVIYVAFSAAEQSVLKHLPKDILRREVVEATKRLGIMSEDCIALNFEVRRFPQQRQEILEKMVELNKNIQPDAVFLPSKADTHQDHQTIAEEGFRAFKKTTMFGYEVPWNNLEFRTSAFITLQEDDINKKVYALAAYQSQSHRNYASEEFIRGLAITRGTQIGTKYAESFELIRHVER